MDKLAQKILYTGLGAAGGLAGLFTAANCSGGGCSSCYGCVSGGALIVVAAAVSRFTKSKAREVPNGLAESGH